jgi:hypothetical protein
MFGKPENRLAEQKSIKGIETNINKAQALMIDVIAPGGPCQRTRSTSCASFRGRETSRFAARHPYNSSSIASHDRKGKRRM